MASARLRKTFKYPSDDDDSGGASRDEMDEEGDDCSQHNIKYITDGFVLEQENVISSLQATSRISNQAYTIIFTLLPLTLTPLFTYYLIFNSTTPARLRLLSLLALTSLLASSFIMFFMSSAPSLDARERLDQRQRQMYRNTIATPSTSASLVETAMKIMDKLDDLRMDLDTDGPLLQSLPILNAMMCGLLMVAGWILKGQVLRGVPDYMWIYLMLPTIMLVMTTIARQSILAEQRELRGLKGLKYVYKGA